MGVEGGGGGGGGGPAIMERRIEAWVVSGEHQIYSGNGGGGSVPLGDKNSRGPWQAE